MEFRELAERYDLAKILHSGRAGTVFRATDRRTGGGVVVKTISAGAIPFEEAAVRFEAFAAALAVLKHPALPAVSDSGISSDGSAFLILEPLDGRRLDLAGKLDLDAAVATIGLLGQALDGLEALASRGLAHGNLTPDNLFAIADGRQLKLLGLGSAAFRGGCPPPFLAPELAQGGVSTARSDLFSFARTTCQLLGASVAQGDSPAVQLPFALTLELADDNALTKILERLLRREPTERPSFRDVRAAFRQALGQATAPAPSPVAMPAPIAPPAPVPVAPPVTLSPPVAPLSPITPAPPLAAVAPMPEPEPPMEGEVLRAITDEVLDALSAPPPPPPVAKTVVAAPPPAAPKKEKRSTVLIGALAAALILAVLVGAWLFLRPSKEETAAPVGPAMPAAPSVPSPEAVLARLKEAQALFADEKETEAFAILREIDYSAQSTLPAGVCAQLAEFESVVSMISTDRFPSDLKRGLDNGDLGLLRNAVETGTGMGSNLPADLKESYDKASHLVELHRQAEAAKGNPVEVLGKMAELASLSPKLKDPLDLRGKAAAAVEGEAEALARDAHYDEAIAKLEPLQRTWSAREGLDARIAGYRTAKDDEAKQKALLDQVPSWVRRKKPHEPLEMLRGIKPTPHLAAQIEAARQSLEAQLAQLDGAAPVVELRPGFGLEYSRGNPVELGFRVRDDYAVTSVRMWAKPPGGKMKEMKLEEHLAGGYWSIELPVSYHQNGTVEFYVVATDRSGHEGSLGTKDQPMKVTRIGSNRV